MTPIPAGTRGFAQTCGATISARATDPFLVHHVNLVSMTALIVGDEYNTSVSYPHTTSRLHRRHLRVRERDLEHGQGGHRESRAIPLWRRYFHVHPDARAGRIHLLLGLGTDSESGDVGRAAPILHHGAASARQPRRQRLL